MNLDILAEKLFDSACLAKAIRMQTENEKKRNEAPDPRKVACEFKDLNEVAKDNYRAMAKTSLNEKIELIECLMEIVNSAAHPDIAVRVVTLDLKPIRNILRKNGVIDPKLGIN